MLLIMFQGHQSFGSWEEDFQRFLLYMGMVAILVMWPRHYKKTFVPHSVEAPYVIWFQLAQRFQRCRLKVLTSMLTPAPMKDERHSLSYLLPRSHRLWWAKNLSTQCGNYVEYSTCPKISTSILLAVDVPKWINGKEYRSCGIWSCSGLSVPIQGKYSNSSIG